MVGLSDIIVKRSGTQLIFRDVDDDFIEAFLYSFESDSAYSTEIIIVPVKEDSSDD